MSLRVKYRNRTEFSNYRFYIPQLCNHQGMALWLDSDMVCFSDIWELLDLEPSNWDFLVTAESYQGQKEPGWGLSLCQFNCRRTRFDAELYFDEIDRGLFSYTDLHQMKKGSLSHHRFEIGPIPSGWNVFDRVGRGTKLIHYTNLSTQPWKSTGHPFGKLWFEYFYEACKDGFITQEDIELAISRSYVRTGLLQGNSPRIHMMALEWLRKVVSHARIRWPTFGQ